MNGQTYRRRTRHVQVAYAFRTRVGERDHYRPNITWWDAHVDCCSTSRTCSSAVNGCVQIADATEKNDTLWSAVKVA